MTQEAKEPTPQDLWGAEKAQKQRRIVDMKQREASITGQVSLLEEELQNIRLEIMALSGEIAGGDRVMGLSNPPPSEQLPPAEADASGGVTVDFLRQKTAEPEEGEENKEDA
jgi:hypothetical protein